MPSGSFSQQLQVGTPQQQQRATRTQRKIAYVQQQRQNIQQQRNFEELKARAEEISSTEFDNLTSIEDYSAKYQKLSPDVKQFFLSPQQVKAQQEEIKVAEKTRLAGVIEKARETYQHKIEVYEKVLRETNNYQYRGGTPSLSETRAVEEKIRNAEYNKQEAEIYLRTLEAQTGKIDEGYDANSIIDYANQKAEEQRLYREGQASRRRAEEKQISLGATPVYQYSGKNIVNNQVVGFVAKEVTIPAELISGQNLTRKALVNYQTEQKQKVKDWQTANPTEELVFDSKGNVISIKSGTFGKTLSTQEYDKAVIEYNAGIKTEEELSAGAEAYSKDFSKEAELANLNPKISITQRVKDMYKSIRLTSFFGFDVSLKRNIQKDMIILRRRNTAEAFEINNILELPKLPANILKIGTIPIGNAKWAIKEDREATYRAEIKKEFFEKLNKLVETAPEELKPYVQEQGIKTLNEELGLVTENVPEYREIFNEEGVSTGREKVGESIVVTDKDFDRSISENMFEFEQSIISQGRLNEKWYKQIIPKTTSQAFLETRIVSTKALEFYGYSKAFGLVGKGGKWIYEGLGGGLKMGKLGLVGGGIMNTAVPTTLTISSKSTLGKIVYQVGKGTIVGILGGAYVISKDKKYRSYKETSGAGAGLFALETFGEGLGFAGAIAGNIYTKHQITKLNKQIAQENYFKQQRKLGLDNIRKYGQYSDKASVGYYQKSVAKPFKLSDTQLKAVAKDYSKITGISEKEALKTISEKSAYKQILSIRDSTVPSTQRALKSIKTGKVTTGSTTYQTSRYGFVQAYKTDKGVQEVAFEFNLKGTRLSNWQLKTTAIRDKTALTNIFERTRVSKKAPEEVWRLKETIATKVNKLKTIDVGQYKVSLTATENKILKTFPYGKDKINIIEGGKLGTNLEQLNSGVLLDKSGKFGNIGTVGKFINVRIESPIYRGGTIKYSLDGEYQAIQAGAGSKSITLKNFIKSLEKGGFFKELARVGQKPSVPVYPALENKVLNKGNSKEVTSVVNKLIKADKTPASADILKQSLLQQQISIAPTTVTFFPKSRLNLKSLVKVTQILDFGTASALATQSVLITKTEQKQRLKEDLQAKLAQQQLNRLGQDLQVRQVQTQNYKQASAQSLAQLLRTPQLSTSTFRVPRVPSITTITPRVPRITPFALFGSGDLKKKIRRKAKITPEIQGLFPDFTARALGLAPKELSQTQAIKEIRKLQTGFGIRTGAGIKGFSPVDEKSLLRGIMK